MRSMATQKDRKLNQLNHLLPEGLLVDAAWMGAHGYSSSLRSQYVSAGWLEQPVRRVYCRPRGELSWQQVVISLQTLLDQRLAVGGRTALELQGYAHFLRQMETEIHLHGPEKPASWLWDFKLSSSFVYHNSLPLFGDDLAQVDFPDLEDSSASGRAKGPMSDAGLRAMPWGQWKWPLTLSTPERAVLELLDELPELESFHQADMLFESLSNLSPRRIQTLLARCRSVKVKRLFMFFADRHGHAWRKHIDPEAIDLGSGKRMLVKGGCLDPTYQITVPIDLVGHI